MPNQPTTSPQDAGPHQVSAEVADQRVAEAIAGVSLAGISVETLEEARRLALQHARFYIANILDDELARRAEKSPASTRPGSSLGPNRERWTVFRFEGRALLTRLLEADEQVSSCVVLEYYGTRVAVGAWPDDANPPHTFELWRVAGEALGQVKLDVLAAPPIPQVAVLAQKWRDLPAGSADFGPTWELLIRIRRHFPDAGFRASVAAGLGFDAGDRLVASIDKALQESATQSSAGGA